MNRERTEKSKENERSKRESNSQYKRKENIERKNQHDEESFEYRITQTQRTGCRR